jgi:putative peptidoglycan lipid II flippase
LYSVAHYALGDTRRPLRYAIVRLVIVSALGYVCAMIVPPRLGIAPEWGAAGLTGSAGVAGWIEFALLRSSLNGRVGHTGVPASYVTRLWAAGIFAAAAAWIVKVILPPIDPILRGAVILPVFGLVYLGMAAFFRIPIVLRGLRGL